MIDGSEELWTVEERPSVWRLALSTAFASKSTVRKAYQEVAVVRRRDPVLVTASGPERILVQCFPVPADGGEMKIRVGVTAPLVNGAMRFPRVLERNFALDPRLEHAIWLQSPGEFEVAGGDRHKLAVYCGKTCVPATVHKGFKFGKANWYVPPAGQTGIRFTYSGAMSDIAVGT